ncbi:MAG: hypothetical protein ACK4S3_07125 [Parvibaculum sp.]|jgi:hypothetical protein
MSPAEHRLFEVLVKAACEGVRCPANDDLPNRKLLSGLCRADHIRCEVYEKNYRVVEIRSGEHAGKRTAEHPAGGKPYRIVDDKGDRWVRRSAGAGRLAVRHAERKVDGRTVPPAPVSLPRLTFLEATGDTTGTAATAPDKCQGAQATPGVRLMISENGKA